MVKIYGHFEFDSEAIFQYLKRSDSSRTVPVGGEVRCMWSEDVVACSEQAENIALGDTVLFWLCLAGV